MTETIGKKIKQIRENANLTTTDLAEASGIGVQQVEMIESGTIAPSISTLIKMSRRMGIRLGTILDGEEQNTPIVSTKRDQRPTVSISNCDETLREHLNFYSLAQKKADRNMEPFVIAVDHSSTTDQASSTHEGEEFIYVLEGNVELRYGNDNYALSKGDSIYYDSIIPHCLSAATEGTTAQVLAVTYTPY